MPSFLTESTYDLLIRRGDNTVFPEYIVIETQGMMRRLNQHATTHNFEHSECFASYMVDEIIQRMKNARTALSKLQKFVLSIAKGEEEYGYQVIPRDFALPVLEFGNIIYLELRKHQLYLYDGTLFYYYHPLADNEFEGIVLKRIHELSLPAHSPEKPDPNLG